MRADWRKVTDQIVAAIQQKIDSGDTDQSVCYTPGELHEMSGASEARSDLFARGFWAAEQRGPSDFRKFRRAGLVFNFEPDETGCDVEKVTFRLNQFNG